MAKKDTIYKNIRISLNSHLVLTDLSTRSGKSILDVVDKVAGYIHANSISYPQLLRKEESDPVQVEALKRVENSIEIIRNIEVQKINPILKALTRIELGTDRILANMEINKNLELEEPINTSKIEIEISQNKPLNSGEIYELKVARETSDLRLKEAVLLVRKIMDKCTHTSSGLKRAFSEEEVEEINKFITKCTAQ